MSQDGIKTDAPDDDPRLPPVPQGKMAEGQLSEIAVEIATPMFCAIAPERKPTAPADDPTLLQTVRRIGLLVEGMKFGEVATLVGRLNAKTVFSIALDEWQANEREVDNHANEACHPDDLEIPGPVCWSTAVVEVDGSAVGWSGTGSAAENVEGGVAAVRG